MEKTVVSSYGASMAAYHPPSFLAPGFVFLLPDSRTKHWSRCLDSRGRLRWGRHLDEAEQLEAQTRLLAAPGLAVALDVAETPAVVTGLDPTGDCIGVFGGMPILPVALGYLSNGWLSPEGLWIPCAAFAHLRTADALHPEEGRGLEATGWAQIKSGVPFWGREHETTEAQAAWLLLRLP